MSIIFVATKKICSEPAAIEEVHVISSVTGPDLLSNVTIGWKNGTVTDPLGFSALVEYYTEKVNIIWNIKATVYWT